MTTTTLPPRVTAGVDAHLDVRVAAALDDRGGLLGVEPFAATPAGYRRLLAWLRRFGDVVLVGVEGTGSCGAGLTRLLLAGGVRVVEVDRPNRQRRRRRAESDPQDAIAAARAARSGDAGGGAKARNGNVESMRVLRVARSSARKARTQTLDRMRSLVSTAPEPVRAGLRHPDAHRLLERAGAYRPGARRDLVSPTKLSLRVLARRAQALEAEVAELDAILGPLVAETAPALVARVGVGTETASALLAAAGDNPDRLRSEATFARLCGASPLDASSAEHERHRLNRGGDRRANSALWRIVVTRLACDPKTRDYIDRRTKEGKTEKEAFRCLERFVAREVYDHLPREHLALDRP